MKKVYNLGASSSYQYYEKCKLWRPEGQNGFDFYCSYCLFSLSMSWSVHHVPIMACVCVFLMPPTSKKLVGHTAFCLFVHLSVHLLVTLFICPFEAWDILYYGVLHPSVCPSASPADKSILEWILLWLYFYSGYIKDIQLCVVCLLFFCLLCLKFNMGE